MASRAVLRGCDGATNRDIMGFIQGDIRMTGLIISMIAVFAQATGPDSAPGLIERLGTDGHAEAESTLLRLGARALPSLRMAAAGREGRVRPHAAALVDRIEQVLLTGPTLVALDYRDRPLKEVIDSLAERSGMRLSLNPANEDRWRNLRVTLREPEPVPFWRAIDRLAREARLQY